MKNKKTLTVIIIVAVILCVGLLIIALNLDNSSNTNTITDENNLFVINFENEAFYDVSTYGVDADIYSESDFARLKNINIDNDNIDEYSVVYYTENPIIKAFFKEKIIVKNFYDNDIIFVTSTDDTQLYVKKDILLPEINKSNISKIVITSTTSDDVSFATDKEIGEFLGNYDYYFKKYNNENRQYECHIYYENSDSSIYEIVNSETFSNELKEK